MEESKLTGSWANHCGWRPLRYTTRATGSERITLLVENWILRVAGVLAPPYYATPHLYITLVPLCATSTENDDIKAFSRTRQIEVFS